MTHHVLRGVSCVPLQDNFGLWRRRLNGRLHLTSIVRNHGDGDIIVGAPRPSGAPWRGPSAAPPTTRSCWRSMGSLRSGEPCYNRATLGMLGKERKYGVLCENGDGVRLIL